MMGTGGLAMLWIAAGITLVGAEIVLPGVYAIWIGLAAVATGLVLFGVPLPLGGQFLLFCAFAAASIWVGRRVQLAQSTETTDAPNLHDLARSIPGRTGTVEVMPGREGRVLRIDDTLWRLREPAPPAGTLVRVVQVDQGELLVEPVS